MWPGIVENSAHFVDQCQLQALQYPVHLIDLLSVLLRCKGFAKIQKAAVYQYSSKAPTARPYLLQVWPLGSYPSRNFLAQPLSQLLYTMHFLLHVTICSRNGSLLLRIKLTTLQNNDFKIFGLFMKIHFNKLFHLSNLSNAKWPQNARYWVLRQPLMWSKRISFNDCSLLVAVNF